MPAITINRLKKIIKEELQVLREGEVEDQAAAVARVCADLIKAIEKFRSAAPAKAKSVMDSDGSSLEKHIKIAEKLLKRITDAPKEHVDGPKPVAAPQASMSTASPAVAQPSADSGKKVSVEPKVKKA